MKKLPVTSIVLATTGLVSFVTRITQLGGREIWLNRLGYQIGMYDTAMNLSVVLGTLCICTALITYIFSRRKQNSNIENEIEKLAATIAADRQEITEALRPSSRLEIFRTNLADYIGRRALQKLPENVRKFCDEISTRADELDFLYDSLKTIIKFSSGDYRTGTVDKNTVADIETFRDALDVLTDWFCKDIRTIVESTIAIQAVPQNMIPILADIDRKISKVTAMALALPNTEVKAKFNSTEATDEKIKLYERLQSESLMPNKSSETPPRPSIELKLGS